MIHKKELLAVQKKARCTRMSQRILAAALSVVLAVGLFPSLSWAQGESTSSAATSANDIAAAKVSDANTRGAINLAATQEQTASSAVEVVEVGATQAEATSSQEATEASTKEEATETAAEEETNEALSVYEPLAEETVTLGTGSTAANYAPYTTYPNASTQILYTSDEIGKTGKITSLSFYVSEEASWEQSEFNVYMGVTGVSSLSAANALSESDLQLVYSNNSQTLGAEAGWETLTLTTPFDYDGSKNLVVAIYRKSAGYKGALNYKCDTNSGKVLRRASESDTSYGEVSGTSTYSAYAYRPYTQLVINTCDHTTLNHHEAVAPACTTGNIEYWECASCGKKFKDSAAKEPITSIKAEHNWGTGEQTLAPTCSETGITTYTCQACGGTKEETAPATRKHNFDSSGKCTNLLRDGTTVCGALDQWDGKTLTEPATDETGTYLISSGEELAWFLNAATAKAYAKNAKLTRNINMGSPTTWYLAGAYTTSSTYSNGYQGTFDGNNNTITINYSNATTAQSTSAIASLFHVVGNEGTIKNVTIKGSFTATSTGRYAGAHAAGIAYYNYGTIQNCKNEATVTASAGASSAYAGGIASWNYGVIEQCINTGEIASTATTTSSYHAYAGGIASYAATNTSINGGTSIIRSCYNSAAIGATKTSTSTSYKACAGGIIGSLPSPSSVSSFTLENCLNSGAITAAHSSSSSSTNDLFAGGVSGCIGYSSGYYAKNTLTNCFYVEGTATATYVSSTAGKVPATETNCGSTTESNMHDADWLGTNLNDWFVDLLATGITRHIVTFEGNNATVQVKGEDVSSSQVIEGQTLSFTITPAEGYGVSSVTFNDGTSTTTLSPAADGTYTTGAITANATVNITTHQHIWNAGEVTTPATCAKEGVTTYSCTVAGCTSTKTEAIAATGKHSLTETKEVPASCTATGTKAYWTCGTCNQLFSDAEGTALIEGQKPETIPALGHEYTKYRDNGDGTHTCICSRCSAEQPGGYTVSATATTTMTAGKTYIITVGGSSASSGTYAVSCEDYSSNSEYQTYRKGVKYTAGDTTVDTTLLWTWGENGSLKSVSTGKYLNASGLNLTMDSAPSTTWMVNANGQVYCVDSNSTTRYLYGYVGYISANTKVPANSAFYEATALETTEACTYGTNGTCTKCGSKHFITVDSTTAYAATPYVSVVGNAGDESASKTSLYLVAATISYVAEGYVPVVGETTLIKDSQDESGTTYKALVSAEVASAISAGTLHVSAAAGTSVASTPALKGDVNASSKLNIVDAQVAYDMACARYSTSILPLANFLAADVNADNELSSADAFAIQHAVVFGWPSSASTAGDDAENNAA